MHAPPGCCMAYQRISTPSRKHMRICPSKVGLIAWCRVPHHAPCTAVTSTFLPASSVTKLASTKDSPSQSEYLNIDRSHVTRLTDPSMCDGAMLQPDLRQCCSRLPGIWTFETGCKVCLRCCGACSCMSTVSRHPQLATWLPAPFFPVLAASSSKSHPRSPCTTSLHWPMTLAYGSDWELARESQ